MLQSILGVTPMDAPVRDQLASIQLAALRRLYSVPVLRRIANDEFKASDPSAVLTMPELFHDVSPSVWSELEGHRNIGPLRRQLQRTHLDTMILLFTNPGGGTPDDARTLAWDQLRKLKARIAAGRSRDEDAYTRVHLDESLMKINRALDAKVILGGQSASRPLSLLDLLGAGDQKPAAAVGEQR